MNMIMGSMFGNPLGGVTEKLTGGDDKKAEGDKSEAEDPEVVAARLEAEERRKEKHRRQEMERESMRQGIREKYNIKKKDDQAGFGMDEDCAGRIGGGKRKTPEELARDAEYEDSLVGQVSGLLGKAKTQAGGVFDQVKGILPFGK